MNILDVGCGKHKRGNIGIDYCKDSEADVIADAHYLPFKDEVFDKVVSTVVLEHSPNPLNFLKEQYRVLKKGGKVELTTDNAQYFSWSVMVPGRGGIRHENYHEDHFMIFYPKNVMRLMKLAGFKVESAYLVGRPIKTKADPIVKILIACKIWRKECLYYRFKIVARKEN